MWICVRSKDAQKQLARTSLSGHGDLSFLFSVFFETLLGGKHSWKALVILISEESPNLSYV